MKKVALLSFAEHREDFYQKRKPLVEKYTKLVKTALSGEAEIVTFEPIRSLEKVREAAQAVRAAGCECAIFYFPIWVTPSFGVVEANLLQLPVLLLANREIETSSLPGMLGTGAGLDQIGFAHQRVCGDIEDPSVLAEIRTFISASHVIASLKGIRYGMFGGRSLGIYSTVIDPSQWQKMFGIDVEQIDQVEIVRKAESIPAEGVDRLEKWLLEAGLTTAYNDTLFTRKHFQKQIRSYLATKNLIRELKLAFVSVKCQQEMSDGYCLQCLSIALLNDGYDADGAKAPIPCACEADGDGALTMMVLNILSGHLPTTLMDVKAAFPEEGLLLLNNCGGMATYFAARSLDPKDNLRKVTMAPHVFGTAGGGATRYVCGPGPLTLARFCRRDGRYRLVITSGEVIAGREELIARSSTCFPHAVVRTGMDIAKFIKTFGSNHIHAVAGDYRKELQEYCRITGIEADVRS
jgi:L-fucose isomerase